MLEKNRLSSRGIFQKKQQQQQQQKKIQYLFIFSQQEANLLVENSLIKKITRPSDRELRDL